MCFSPINGTFGLLDFRRGREFVENRFRDPSLCLNDVARHACLAPTHFSHVFRQTTGTRFTRFVQARRVAEAKKQLMDARKSITDVCFACGFNSLTHFNRVFRAFEHRSPLQHRQSNASQRPAWIFPGLCCGIAAGLRPCDNAQIVVEEAWCESQK